MTIHQRIALIPAYEPEEALIDLAHQARRAGLEPIIVDDGSGASYHTLFARLRDTATVITHERNRGRGRAIKTGLAYIRENFAGYYIVVILDANDQHGIQNALQICQFAQEHPDALVLGQRTSSKRRIPWYSRVGNKIIRCFCRITTGLFIHDTLTDLLAFSNQLLPTLEGIGGNRYNYEIRTIFSCARRHIPIQEVPIQTLHDHRQQCFARYPGKTLLHQSADAYQWNCPHTLDHRQYSFAPDKSSIL